jgi:hypothetical protein
MALRKVTAEIKQAMNLTAENMIELINSGQLKGKIDGVSIYIDDSALPEGFLVDKPQEQSTDKTNEVAKTEPTTLQNNEHHEINAQSIVQQTEKIKAETAKIKAQIDLKIAEGERDRPQILAQREAKIVEVEKTLAQKQDDLNNREITIKNREIILAGEEQKVKDKSIQLNARLAQVEIEIKQMYDTKDIEISKKNKELEKIQAQVDIEKMTLQNIDNSIEEAKLEIPKLIERLKKLIDVSLKYFAPHQGAGQNSKGQVEQWNFQMADSYWGIKERGKRLLNNLQQVLGMK